MDLQSLGATATILGAFQPHAAQGLTLARVAISQRDQYRLYLDAGEVDAEPSGSLWYRSPDKASMPVVGDWVAARVVGPDQAIVEAVLPRATLFSRRAAGRREDQQPIAANVDLVFLVCGLDGDFNVRRLERYLTLAAESGAAPVIVLNKADACEDSGGADRGDRRGGRIGGDCGVQRADGRGARRARPVHRERAGRSRCSARRGSGNRRW